MRSITVFFFHNEDPIEINNVVDIDPGENLTTIHAHQMNRDTMEADCVDCVIPTHNIKFIQVVTKHDNQNTTH